MLWRTTDHIVRRAKVVKVHHAEGGKSQTAQIALDDGANGPKVDVCHMVAPLYARAHDDVDDGPATWFDDDAIAAARVRAIPLGSRVLAYTPTESKKASNWRKCNLQAVDNPIAEHCDAAKLAAADAAERGDSAGGTPRHARSNYWWNATKWTAMGKLNSIVRVWQVSLFHFIYRYISCESCSQFDLLPLIYFTRTHFGRGTSLISASTRSRMQRMSD